jgi:2-methylcitrate dehydratase PrpD
MAISSPNPSALSGAPEDFAAVLARFACSLRIESTPPRAVAAAKSNVFDTLSCAVAGSTAKGIGELREIAVEWGGAPQSTILVSGEKVPSHHAAWVNGAMAHARDYDDTHDTAVLHAGVSVVPAALAAAEWRFGATGSDFLAGVTAGLETICRLGVATKIGIVDSGYMYTSLFGYFAATVAAGRVLGLTETEMVNALGIVYSQVAGNHQVTRDGALTKRMQPGFAAKAALVSVQLAMRGVRGTQNTFEGLDGFFRVYLQNKVDVASLRVGLGERFEMCELSYKPYPCCRFNHTSIEAALNLAEEKQIDPGMIERIRVGVTRQAFEAVCTPLDVRKAPQTLVHAQFSIPFTVAVALVDGCVGLTHFTDVAIRREDILQIAKRVEPYIDEEIERDWSRNVSPSRLRIEMMDGTCLEAKVDLPLGHPERPMSAAASDWKARDCFHHAAMPLKDDALARFRSLVDEIETQRDVRTIIQTISFAN